MISTTKDAVTISRESYDELHSTLLDALNDTDFLRKDNQIMLDFIHYMNLDEKYQHFCILRSPTAASAVANGSRAALSGSGNATRFSAAAGAVANGR